MALLVPLKPMLRNHAKQLAGSESSDTITINTVIALRILHDNAEIYDAVCFYCHNLTQYLTPLLALPHIPEDDRLLLLEDALLYIREGTLRLAPLAAPAEELALMSWVAECGMWRPGDGLIFSQEFFTALPLSILKDVISHSAVSGIAV